jgi:hypothetical protein
MAPKQDVYKWLLNLKKYNKIEKYRLSEKQIEEIWDTVGWLRA